MTAPQLHRIAVHTALTERVLMMGSADAIPAVLPDIDPTIGGVVILGAKAPALARQLRDVHPGLVVIVQPDTHEHRPATIADPFPFNAQADGMLDISSLSLDDWVSATISYGSMFAVLPTGYLDAGAHAEVRAVVERANLIDRTDVILHLPLNHKWMVRPGDRTKIIAAVGKSRHPVVISLANKMDPASQKGVVSGIHEVLGAVGDRVGLWYSDLGVLDALANGGWCGAVGLTSNRRHIVAPADRAFAPRPRDKTPNVLLPSYLRWKRAQTMTEDWFANGHEPHCDCANCQGRALNRFTAAGPDIVTAHRHNTATITRFHRALLTAGPDRLTVWSDMLADAEVAHAATATATGIMTIKPSLEQRAWTRNNPVPVRTP